MQTENKRNYMTQQEKCEAYEINGARWWHPENCVRTRSFQRARFDLCAAELHHTVIDIYIYHMETYLVQQQNCTIIRWGKRLRCECKRNIQKKKWQKKTAFWTQFTWSRVKCQHTHTEKKREKKITSSDRKRSQQDKNGCCCKKNFVKHIALKTKNEKKNTIKSDHSKCKRFQASSYRCILLSM